MKFNLDKTVNNKKTKISKKKTDNPGKIAAGAENDCTEKAKSGQARQNNITLDSSSNFSNLCILYLGGRCKLICPSG